METTIHILLIDPDPAAARRVRDAVSAGPGGAAYLIDWVADPSDAGATAAARPPDVILLGLPGPATDRPDLVAGVRRRWPAVPFVLLTDAADATEVAAAPPPGTAGEVPGRLCRDTVDADRLTRAVRHAVSRRYAGADPPATADRQDNQHSQDRHDLQNLLRRLIDHVPDHVYAKDLDGRFTVVNAATWQFFGAAADGLIGKTDFDLFPPDVAGWFRAEERDLLESGRPCLNREAEVADAAGRRRWIITNKVPLRDAAGRVVGVAGINRDVTDRRQAMDQLREANDALAAANDSLARANASLADANAALARREQELVAAVDGLRRSHEELRAAQLGLVQAAKLESVGRLAAGVAHEVKNPLAVLAMGVEYLTNCPDRTTEAAAQALKSMGDAARKADRVIRGLLDFSAPTTLVTAPADLNAVVDQALALVRHELARSGIRLRQDLAADLPPATIDPNKVEQVFVNLLMNAVHAMPAGGVLTVRTYATRLPGRQAAGPDAATAGVFPTDPAAADGGDSDVAVVVAEVDDTGPGVPEHLLPRVFDPFFTTKPAGKGTGLGLSVARTIVELHRGKIVIANRPDGGARATVTLPA